MDDSSIKKVSSSALVMHRNSFVGDELDLASKQDLRKTKAELFNKLVGSQSQQLIVTPSKNNIEPSLNGSSKDDNSINLKQQQTSKEGQIALNDEQVVFARTRSRWYTNEEVASILTSFNSHPEWQTNELQVRPQSGAVLLYSREKVRYRQDGYCWKKRKNGRTTREDHMKLKVQGIECIYGCYVHSAILPTFHRRCYWLLQNPDIVLVHYLNQPPDDQSRMMLTFNSSLLEADTRRSWTNEEIIEEIGSVFGGISQIHHTLSINFPPDDIIDLDQEAPTKNSSVENGSMIEMSPQSQATSHSELLNEQNDLNVTENQRMICSSESQDKDLNNNNDKKSIVDHVDQTIIDEDELMAVSQESNSHTDGHKVSSTIESITNSVVDAQQNSDIHGSVQADASTLSIDAELIQQQQHDDPISMAFDVVSECRDNEMNDNEICDQRERSTTSYKFVTGSTNSMSLDNLNTSIETSSSNNGGNILQNSSSLCSQQTINHTDGQMDQGSCSPVTQIYNKIVDDIETYALPIEPNQFDSTHHHHHHHHHHNMSISSSLPDQTMDLGGASSELQQTVTNHSQIISGTEVDHKQQQQQQLQREQQHHLYNHPQQQHCQIQSEQEEPIAVQHQFNETTRGRNLKEPNHDQSDHSVDFISCDLFGECDLDEIEQGANGHDRSGGCDGNSILLNDFHLPDSGEVSDDLGANVVDSIANADDFRDLIMGMPSPSSMDINGDTSGQTSNLLIDNNSLDLFNFKSSSNGEQKNQLEVKSTTSETDTLNRLSPMAPLVPRCNSTDNAMQPACQRLDQFQHHLSSHYLAALTQQQQQHQQQQQQHHHQQHQLQQDTLVGKTFSEYNHHNNLTSHRSTASTNPSNSTSCSPSPSSSSLLTAGNPSSTRSAYLEGSHCSTGSSSNSFIKLPLQQRQKSEQREPSNSVLSSLLPKALSLDGSDLSTNRHHRNHQLHNPHHHHYFHGLQSPMSPYMMTGGIGHDERITQQQNNNILLVPNSSNVNGTSAAGQQHATNASQISSNQQQFYQHQRNSAGSHHLSSIASASSMSVALIDSNQAQDNQYQNRNQNNPMLASNLCPLQSSNENSLDNQRQYVNLEQLNGRQLLTIVDYVPNWTPSSGGTKVLLIANWKSLACNSKSIPSQLDGSMSNSFATNTMVVKNCNNINSSNRRLSLSSGLTSSSALAIKSNEFSGGGASWSGHTNGGFSVVFGSTLVPATLIQDNVLRCYSPAHEPGFISLKVLYMERIVSEQVVFEVRRPISEESVALQQVSSANSSCLLDEQQQQQPRHNGAFIGNNQKQQAYHHHHHHHHHHNQSETIKQ